MRRNILSGAVARERLRILLLEKSYRKGEFTLTSGKTSDFYIDGKVTSLDDEGAWLFGISFAEMIAEMPRSIAGVAGLTLGGDPLVTATVMANYFMGYNSLKALIIRKETKKHGTGHLMEGTENISSSASLVVLDDTATTGGSIVKSIVSVIAGGYSVPCAIVGVDRQEGAVEKVKEETGVNLYSIFTREQLLA